MPIRRHTQLKHEHSTLLMNKLLVCILIICVFGCQEKQCLRSEEKIISEIFPEIVDSFKLNCPAFPPNILSYSDELYKTIDDLTLEQKIERSKNPNIDIALGVIDSLLGHDSTSLITIRSEFLKKGYKIEQFENIVTCKVNLEHLSISNNVSLLYFPTWPKNRTEWRKKFEFYFEGYIGFSRIILNERENYGAFKFVRSFGVLDGSGHWIFIKKQGNSWEIDKIELAWIS